MEYKIRKAELIDLPGIMQIEQKCFKEPWQEVSFREEIVDHEVFVLYYEADLIGYICGWKILDEYNITNLAIKQDFRRKGLAQKLVWYVLDIHRQDCCLIYLEVRESNFAARELYKKNGFSVIGIRKDYYADPREDALLMALRFAEEV